MSDSLKYWLLVLIAVGVLFLSWLGLRMARYTASAVETQRNRRPPLTLTNAPAGPRW